MITLILSSLIALIIAVIGWVHDVTQTVKGIEGKVALENFTWLVGSTPSAKALYLRDSIFFIPFVLGPIFFVLLSGTAAMLPVLLGPLAFAGRHFQAGQLWKTLSSMTYNERIDYLNRPRTAWQKFWGAN
jgi:hypothetical protein